MRRGTAQRSAANGVVVVHCYWNHVSFSGVGMAGKALARRGAGVAASVGGCRRPIAKRGTRSDRIARPPPTLDHHCRFGERVEGLPVEPLVAGPDSLPEAMYAVFAPTTASHSCTGWAGNTGP